MSERWDLLNDGDTSEFAKPFRSFARDGEPYSSHPLQEARADDAVEMVTKGLDRSAFRPVERTAFGAGYGGVLRTTWNKEFVPGLALEFFSLHPDLHRAVEKHEELFFWVLMPLIHPARGILDEERRPAFLAQLHRQLLVIVGFISLWEIHGER